MNNKGGIKLLGIAGAVLTGLGALLPYVSMSAFGFTENASLINDVDGWVVLVIALVALIGEYVNITKLVMLSGAAAVFAFLWENSVVANHVGEMGIPGLVQHGAGYYCLVIGGIALIAWAIMGAIVANEEN